MTIPSQAKQKSTALVLARSIQVTDRTIVLALEDGRETRTPLSFYPVLLRATPAQRNDVIRLGEGEGFAWPQLDLELSVASLCHSVPVAGPKPETVFKQLKKTQQVRAAGRKPRRKAVPH